MRLLLVSAVVLLASPALASPTRPHRSENLNHLFDLAKNYTNTLSETFFVEDVSHLAEGNNKCKDKFFCKVHQILDAYGKKHGIPGRNGEEKLVRNLKTYIDSRNVTCADLLKDMVASGDEKPVTELLGHLTRCMQSRNLHGASK